MTVKDIKKGFRVMRRKASSRQEKKTLRTAEKDYFVLLEQKKQQYDAIQLQKAKIDSMQKAIERGRESAANVQKLRTETDSLKAVMRAYVREIDSLMRAN
jgi:Holliday junction resolvase